MEFVGDTGAGEWLGSFSALQRQGIPFSDVSAWVGTSSCPLRFTTGGGPQSATSTLGLLTPECQHVQNVYMLRDCPMVMSIGHMVAHEGFSFHWAPSGLPWLQSPTGEGIPATWVDHNVPIFRFPCSFQYGLPSLSTPGGESELHTAPLLEPLEAVPAQGADGGGSEQVAALEPSEAVPAHGADGRGRWRRR